MTDKATAYYRTFLQAAGEGTLAGAVANWPQLRPACEWAIKEIERLQQNNKLLYEALMKLKRDGCWCAIYSTYNRRHGHHDEICKQAWAAAEAAKEE